MGGSTADGFNIDLYGSEDKARDEIIKADTAETKRVTTDEIKPETDKIQSIKDDTETLITEVSRVYTVALNIDSTTTTIDATTQDTNAITKDTNTIVNATQPEIIATHAAVNKIRDYQLSGTFLYPKFAPPVLLTTAATAYVEGAPVTIVPNGAIVKGWTVKGLALSNLSKVAQDYIITLYDLLSDKIIAEATMRVDTPVSGTCQIMLQGEAIQANTGLYGKIAISGGGVSTLDLKILYGFI